MRRRGRLSRKYLVILVGLVTGALLASGAVEIYSSYTENKAALVALQREKASGAGSRIESFVRDIERQLVWTTQPLLVSTPEAAIAQRRIDAARLQRQVLPITEVSHLDAAGREQLRLSRLAMDVIGSQTDYSGDPKFRVPRSGRTYFGPVYFRKESEPYMTIAMPQAGGGVTVAEVNLKFIWDVVSQIKVGKAGVAYVVDGGGALIAHPDISLVLQKTSLAGLEQVKAVLANVPGDREVTIARDLKGREVLTAHSTITPLGWVVLVEQPLEEAFAPLYASAYRTIGLVALGIALAVVVSVVLARRLARPIQVLQESAAKIGAGELDHRISIQTGDELEALADEFNRMTGRLRESYATLEQKVEDRTRELSEALEQQTATAEILKVISSSPTDVQPVLDAVTVSAARLCGANDAMIMRVENGLLKRVAHYGSMPTTTSPQGRPLTPGTAAGRAILERRTIQVEDTGAEVTRAEYPELYAMGQQLGFRTVLATPLLREDSVDGVVVIRRMEQRRFTPTQVSLLQTFADQAAIAIENVRLFTELEARNAALTESLERQTATADILRVISSSPTDVQPVFDALAQSAVRLCGAADVAIARVDGAVARIVGSAGRFFTDPQVPDSYPIGRGSVIGRAIVDRGTLHIRDLALESDEEFPEGKALQRAHGHHTMLATPLLRAGEVIGAIVALRTETRPFSEQQVALLQTFADQAVIAIENVRLFTELEEKNRTISEALDQQTATAEILRVISGSPTDVQPVLDAVAENATRVCEARDGAVLLIEGRSFRIAAHHGAIDMPLAEPIPVVPGTVAGRAVLEGGPVHVPDLLEAGADFPEGQRLGARFGNRTTLAAPLLREGVPIGALLIRRTEVRPFSDKQIALLQTFADQAVIAIENVRLFTELEARNAALTEALGQQTATAEILRVISGSPTDAQPVFDAIVQSMVRLCDSRFAIAYRYDGAHVYLAAHHELSPELLAALNRRYPERPSPDTSTGLSILERRVIHVHDAWADDTPAGSRDYARLLGHRTVLAVPMLREGQPIGSISALRMEMRPFTEQQIALVKTFADQAVIAIENVRLFTELQARTAELTRSVGELQALGEVGRAISSTLDLETVLATIVSRANELAESDGGVIYEFDEGSRSFQLRATDRFPEDFVAALRAARLVYGEGAAGQAVATRAPVQVPDVGDTDAYSSRVREALVRSGYRSLLAVPLVSEDEVVGALVINRRTPGAFAPRTVELLSTFATQSALAIQNARLFREIEDKSRELEVANRHKDEFLASMSHELRTPLNAIIGFSEVMLERMFGDVNPKQEEYLNDILSSGRHLLSLINDILDLAKIEAGRMELEPTEFHLPQAIDNALILVRERALRRGIELDRWIDPQLGQIKGDERKVKQVLLNLLSNAVKFTPEGGRIDVRAGLTDGFAEISVADTGVGIAPEDQEAVFEEFRQVGTDYARKHEGTGLGLALARKFVELHGGTIWVKSELGQGATFTFTIPVEPWQAS